MPPTKEQGPKLGHRAILKAVGRAIYRIPPFLGPCCIICLTTDVTSSDTEEVGNKTRTQAVLVLSTCTNIPHHVLPVSLQMSTTISLASHHSHHNVSLGIRRLFFTSYHHASQDTCTRQKNSPGSTSQRILETSRRPRGSRPNNTLARRVPAIPRARRPTSFQTRRSPDTRPLHPRQQPRPRAMARHLGVQPPQPTRPAALDQQVGGPSRGPSPGCHGKAV